MIPRRALGGAFSLGLSFAISSTACETPCENPTSGTLGELSAWEEAFLDGQGVPASPTPSFLLAEDGLPLAFHDWVPDAWDGSGAMALVVPGSSAYAELYAVLGAGLSARGVHTRVIDVRGHGRSVCSREEVCGEPLDARRVPDDGAYWVGRPGDSADENQIARDLGRHVADMRERWPDARLLLAGHSSGGGVVTRYVENVGMGAVDEIALLAPFNHAEQAQNIDDGRLCPDKAGSAYAQVDLGALGDALRGNVHRYVVDFVKDPSLQGDLDTLRYTFTTLQGMAARNPDDFWSAYERPILWIAAADDHLFDLERSRQELERGAPGSVFVVMEDTSHVGLSWSDDVAGLLASWAASGVVEETATRP